MKIIETDIKDLKLIQPKVFGDERGFFLETYRKQVFDELGLDIDFVQDNMSKSVKGTLRGLHYQIENTQDKLITCLNGKVLDVAVDLRQSSPTFGKHHSVILSEENKHTFFVPKGFAHGFSVLSEEALVYYKCSDYYNQSAERGLYWNDPSLEINWEVSNPFLSEKDKIHPRLEEIKKEDLFR